MMRIQKDLANRSLAIGTHAEDLAEFEWIREEAQIYDHRRLGKQLDLFSLIARCLFIAAG